MLPMRATSCCSNCAITCPLPGCTARVIAFTLTVTGGSLVVEVAVPESRMAVLDALAARVAATTGIAV